MQNPPANNTNVRTTREAVPRTAVHLPLGARLALLVLLALVAEIFLFNCSYWATMGNKPIVLSDTPITIDSGNDAIVFDDLDVSVSNITFAFSGDRGIDAVFARYTITDDGMSEAYALPKAEMQTSVPRSLTQSLHTYGNLRSLTIAFPPGSTWNEDTGQLLDANSYPIIVESVTLNTVIPFSFNALRFFLVLGALLLLYAFHPGSSVYKLGALDAGCMARRARTAAVAALAILACVGVLAFPHWMQLATSWFNAEEWDGSAAVTFVEPDWYTDVGNSEYDDLAKSFASGSLSLLDKPPAWMSQVDDPYNPGTQRAMAKETGEGFRVDAAYCDGNYYVYFGVVPVLVLYLPFLLATGHDLPNAIAVMVPCALFAIGLYFLLRSLVRRKFPQVNLGVFLLVYLATAACSAIMFGIGRPTLYQVPFAFARCLTVWGLFLWLEGRFTGRAAQLVGGSVCMALVAGCRPQFLVFSIAAIPLLCALWKSGGPSSEREAGKTHRAVATVAIIVPFVAVGIALAWYNAARFGSPFDFGASRNLAGNDMSLRGFVPARLADGLFAYLLQPARMIMRFPFLVPVDLSTSYEGMVITEPLAGGIFATQPFLWAALAGLGLRRTRPRAFAAIVALLVAGLVVCCFDIQASGVLGRYYQDFSLAFALAAVLAAFAFFDDGGRAGDCRIASRRGLLYSAVAITMAYSFFAFLFMFNNAGCNTAGGSDPVTWEFLRQTFEFWI